jgi:ABC-2 type transport system ATP-binding protein
LEQVIVVNKLTKRYKDGTLAADQVSFEVGKSEVFGFLGLNGAGKTTTLKMISTLISPTSGTARVLGYDISKNGLEIRERIGVVQQQESYDRNLNVESSLKVYASLWGIERKEALERIEFLVEKFDLKEIRRRRIRWLSFGQRKRLQVAREFLHDSSLLILDEPTVGMDVIARHNFLQFCREIAKTRTVFFTTHIISEAEYLCDRVAIIHKGRIVALDVPKALKSKYDFVRAVSIVPRDHSDLGRISTLTDSLNFERKEILEENNELRLVSEDPYKLAYDAAQLLSGNALELETITVMEPSLEDVMVRLVEAADGGVSN